MKWNRKKSSGVAIKNDEQEKSVEMGINGQFISLQTDVGDRGKKEIQVNGVGAMKKSSNDGRSHSRKHGIWNGKTNATDDDKIDTRDANETKGEKKERKSKQMQRQEKQNEAKETEKERKERGKRKTKERKGDNRNRKKRKREEGTGE